MLEFKGKISLPAELTVTRIAPRALDSFDNGPCSVKYIVDAVCAEITGDFRPGRADGNKGISIVFAQEKSKDYAVKILIKY